jgi:uncharacterized membrane protein YfcA
VIPLLLAGALAGLLGGLTSGIFGVGGGVVLVPLLSLLLGLDQHQAQGVTLAVLLLPIGLPAVVSYHRHSPIDAGLVALLVLGFLAGVGAGAVAANALPEQAMRLVFVAFLGFTAWRSWQAGAGGAAAGPHRSRWHGLWIGALGGVASGLLGVGGGIVMLPLLTGVLGQSRHQAQGTSLATMLPPVGLPGVLVYARAQGGLHWPLVATLALAFAAAGFAGARIANRTGAGRLSRAFALYVCAAAAILLWKALR